MPITRLMLDRVLETYKRVAEQGRLPKPQGKEATPKVPQDSKTPQKPPPRS